MPPALANAQRANADPARVERFHRLVKAASFLAEQVVSGTRTSS